MSMFSVYVSMLGDATHTLSNTLTNNHLSESPRKEEDILETYHPLAAAYLDEVFLYPRGNV